MNIKLMLYYISLSLFILPLAYDNEEFERLLFNGLAIRQAIYWTAAFTIAVMNFTFTISPG